MKRIFIFKWFLLLFSIATMSACGQGSSSSNTAPPATPYNPYNMPGNNFMLPNTLGGIWKSAQNTTLASGSVTYNTYQFAGSQLTIKKFCISNNITSYSMASPPIVFNSATTFQINGAYYFNTNGCALTVEPSTVTYVVSGTNLTLTKRTLLGTTTTETLIRVQ